jgi:hypothetical protein
MQLKPKNEAIAPNTLTMEVFGCLHNQVDVYLHNCANAISSLKGPNGPPFLSWLFFFDKKFQSHYKGCKHLPSTSQFPPLHDTSPISTIDFITNGQFFIWKNMADLLQAVDF